MQFDGPVPLTDFQSPPVEPQPGEESDRPVHPENSAILTPADAANFLGQQTEPSVAALSATEGRRCAWLSAGARDDEPYTLHWSGPLDSSYDWVALTFEIPTGIVVCQSVFGRGWQWASQGNSYQTSWSGLDIVRAGGSAPEAKYFVWDKRLGGYMAEPRC